MADDDVTEVEKPGDPVDDVRVHLMPEYLVVCAWRSIKEVSLLLGQLTSTAPFIVPNEVTDPNNEVTDPGSKVIDTDVKVDECGSSCPAEWNDGLLTVDLVSESCTVLSCVYTYNNCSF